MCGSAPLRCEPFQNVDRGGPGRVHLRGRRVDRCQAITLSNASMGRRI